MKPLIQFSLLGLTGFAIFLAPQQSSAYYFDNSRTLHLSNVDDTYYPLFGHRFTSYSDSGNQGSVVRHNLYNFPSISTNYRGKYFTNNLNGYNTGVSTRHYSYPTATSKTQQSQYWYEYRYDGRMY